MQFGKILLKDIINILIADRYVLFENGDKIDEYKFCGDIPEEYKNAYVMHIMSPHQTAFYNTSGDMFIDIKFY